MKKAQIVINYNGISEQDIPDGRFRVPYHFHAISIPPSTKENPYLVGHIRGSGVIQAITFHVNYYGVSIGYSTDGNDMDIINNGHCLKEWRADSPSAIGFPVRLLEWKHKYNLAIGVTTPIKFQSEFKLFFVNLHRRRAYNINSLHVYGYFEDLQFGKGNKLKI